VEFEGLAQAGGGKVGYLAQEPALAGETVGSAVEASVASSRETLARFEELSTRAGEEGVLAELEAVQDEIDARDLWDLERRVESTLSALRCPPREAETRVLSGGERRRVALAALILENNDMLLLDEPTNHLDPESIAWLEGYLKDFKGTVVCVTHDRYFLDRITQWVLELDDGKGLPFEGSYAQWLEMKLRTADERRAGSLRAELDCFKERGDDRPALRRLQNFDSLLDGVPPHALFVPAGPRLGRDVLKATALGHAFGDRVLFEDVSFEIPRGAIVGLVGPNGAGKSTMVDLLAKHLEPTSGRVDHGETVVLATADQSRRFDSETDSVFDAVADGLDEIDVGASRLNARRYLAWFGFLGAQQSTPVAALSGGERNRAFLARQLRASANVLVLDEPSNDLDVATLRALEDALLAFAGTVLVVSHDRFFLDRIATHVLAFEPVLDRPRDDGAPRPDSQVVFFAGNWAEYEADRRRRYGDALPKPLKFNRNQLAVRA